MTKRLNRSRQSVVIAGVCGGVAEYFDIDPVIVRILTVILVFWHGVGLLGYIVAWIAMPKAPLAEVVEPVTPKEPSVTRKYLPGIVLIAIGTCFLFDRIFWWFHWRYIWPCLLILGGVALIWRSTYHKNHDGGMHESYES